MKKFSRIFALLLTVALIVGAISIIASAATYDASKLVSGSTGIKNAINFTFENGTNAQGQYLDSTHSVPYSAMSASDSGKTIITSKVVSDASGNHYIRYQHGADLANSNKYVTIPKAASVDYSAPNYKYVVFDLDFTTDAYLNAEGTDIDPNATSGKLAYPEGAGMAIQANVANAYLTNAYLCSNGNDWYVGSATKYENSKYLFKLEQTEAGVWNHLTMIFDTAGYYYVYINGAYGWSGYAAPTSGTVVQNNNFNYRVVKDVTSQRQYAFCLDNITSNVYDATYASSESVYGLDDFIAVDYSANIGACEDVVGNSKNYSNVAMPENNFKVGDTEYALLSEALKALPAGGQLIAYKDFILPAVFGPNTYTVICKNGATATLAKDAVEGYFVQKHVDGDDTVYKLTVNPRYGIDGIYTCSNFNFEDGKKFDPHQTSQFALLNLSNGGTELNKYAYISVKTKGQTSATATAFAFGATKSSTTAELVNQYSAYVYEFDMAGGENYFNGMHLSIFNNIAGKYYNFGYTVLNEGKWYFTDNSTYAASTAKVALPVNGEWAHFVLIAYDNATGAYFDVYVNGEYFTTVTAVKGFRMERLAIRLPSGTNVDPADKSEIRIDNFWAGGFGSKEVPYNSGSAFGLDDYATLGDKTLPLTFVSDLLYNNVFTFESPSAPNVNIGTGNYYNLAAAFATLVDGDTITLTEDLKLYAPLDSSVKTLYVNGANVVLLGEAAERYTFADGVLTKNVAYSVNWTDGENVVFTQELNPDVAPDPTTLNINFANIKGDYKNAAVWEIAFGGSEDFVSLLDLEWLTLEDGESVTLRPMVGTVAWFAPDGETQLGDVETWFVGTVEARSFDGLASFDLLDNGWYEHAYIGWNSLEETYSLANGEHKEFVAIEGYKSSIDAKHNYTLGTCYFATLYLPEEIENVKVISVVASGAGGNVVPQGVEVNIGGVKHTAYQSAALATYSWYPAAIFTVTFEVDGAKGVQQVTTEFSFKVSDYITAILNRYECGSAEENLIIHWIQFVANSYAVLYDKNYKPLQAAADALTNHFTSHPDCQKNLLPLDDQVPDAADETLTYKSITELGSGFGATYAFISSSVRFGLYVPVEFVEANKDVNITVSFVGMANGKTNQKITCKLSPFYIDGSKASYNLDGVKCYLYVAELDAISVYNIEEKMTINVSAGEINKSVTYSYAEYLYNTAAKMPAEPTAQQTATLDLLKSYAAFSKASKAYMLDGVEIPE